MKIGSCTKLSFASYVSKDFNSTISSIKWFSNRNWFRMGKSNKLTVHLQVSSMLLFLIIFFELKVVRSFSLSNLLCKSSKSSFCSHADAWRKTYQLKFAISGVHLGKILRVWGLDADFGLFPYIENSSHKTVYV